MKSPLWAPFNNGAWKRQWVTVNHGCLSPAASQMKTRCKQKVWRNCSRSRVLLFLLQSTPWRAGTYSVPWARLTARSKFERVSLTIWLPVLFSDLSCEVFPLVLSCGGVKAVLSQWRLYCNQLFSSGIQSLRSRQRNPRGSPQTQSGPLSTQL